MKTMKSKILRLMLVLLFPAALLTALTGCQQESTKSDSPSMEKAGDKSTPPTIAPPTNITPPKASP